MGDAGNLQNRTFLAADLRKWKSRCVPCNNQRCNQSLPGKIYRLWPVGHLAPGFDHPDQFYCLGQLDHPDLFDQFDHLSRIVQNKLLIFLAFSIKLNLVCIRDDDGVDDVAHCNFPIFPGYQGSEL